MSMYLKGDTVTAKQCNQTGKFLLTTDVYSWTAGKQEFNVYGAIPQFRLIQHDGIAVTGTVLHEHEIKDRVL